MSENKNYGLLISALVAIVAIVGLVVLLRGDSTGSVVVIRGEAQNSFGRPLGSSGNGISGEDLPCYYTAEGDMYCPGIGSPSGTFGADSDFREQYAEPPAWGVPNTGDITN